jgi:hypothetical protein
LSSEYCKKSGHMAPHPVPCPYMVVPSTFPQLSLLDKFLRFQDGRGLTRLQPYERTYILFLRQSSKFFRFGKSSCERPFRNYVFAGEERGLDRPIPARDLPRRRRCQYLGRRQWLLGRRTVWPLGAKTALRLVRRMP